MLKIAPTPIIILNWNGIKDTLECLESVLNMTYTNFIVYLVDNASEDGSQEILIKQYSDHPKIKLIFNKENLGFTRGNNLILRQILQQPNLPEYVTLLNNDTAVEEDWLENILKSATNNQAAIVASKMIDYYERDKMDNAGHLMLNTGEILPIGHGLSTVDYNKGFENLGACAGAGLYSLEMLRNIGIFDQHFTTGYEDAELGYRASVAGYKCWYEPTAKVYHKMGQSIKKIFNYEYSLSIQKHILYSYFKLTPLSVIVLSLPFILVKYTAMLLTYLIFWRLKFFKITCQAIKETIVDDFLIIKKERQKFLNKRNKKATSLQILRKQTFFLWFDLLRFYKYIILNRRTSLDAYGKIEKV